MRVHGSQTYRKMDVTWERISHILELREILLSFQTGFSLVSAAVVCVYLRDNLNNFCNFSLECELSERLLFFLLVVVVVSKCVCVCVCVCLCVCVCVYISS